MAPNVRRKREKGQKARPWKRRLQSPVAAQAYRRVLHTSFLLSPLLLYYNKEILTLAHVNCRGFKSLRVLNVEQVLKMRLNSSW
jgi:hypothetical protein